MLQNEKLIYRWIYLLPVVCLIFTGCQTSIYPNEARLCGRYSKEIYHAVEDSSTKVQLLIETYFAEGYVKKEIQLNDDGTFTIDIPVACNTWCQIGLEGYYIGVFLSPGQKTEFEITMDQFRRRKLKMVTGIGWTEDDIKEDRIVFDDIVLKIKPYWDWIPAVEYHQHVINNLNEIEREVEDNTRLPQYRKKAMMSSLRMNYLVGWILNDKETEDRPKPPLEKLSDFTFLKYFNLNDLSEFYTPAYTLVLHKILEIDLFHIPPIGDAHVEIWLKEVKLILAELIGSNTGFFYDLLAANSYYLQLKNGSKPFSDKQIENIRAYFPNETYINVLMAENEKTIGLIQSNMKEKPNVSKEELLKAIVSQYEGKVVVVDFWATWCLPCLNAMRFSKGIKEEFKEKGVVFLYLSAPSSEKKEWERIVRNEKGAHYFIDTEDEWKYILSLFGFSAIPSYLIYDVNGYLKYHFTGYPGNAAMEEMIEALLP